VSPEKLEKWMLVVAIHDACTKAETGVKEGLRNSIRGPSTTSTSSKSVKLVIASTFIPHMKKLILQC
jgi:hypothetical protein